MSLITNLSILHQGIFSLTILDYLLAANVYVAYRNIQPETETVIKVQQELKKLNIDVNQLVKRRADNCQQAYSTTEGGSSA